MSVETDSKEFLTGLFKRLKLTCSAMSHTRIIHQPDLEHPNRESYGSGQIWRRNGASLDYPNRHMVQYPPTKYPP